jgi:hypothetical protein
VRGAENAGRGASPTAGKREYSSNTYSTRSCCIQQKRGMQLEETMISVEGYKEKKITS